MHRRAARRHERNARRERQWQRKAAAVRAEGDELPADPPPDPPRRRRLELPPVGSFSRPAGVGFAPDVFLGQVERLTEPHRIGRERHHLERLIEAQEVADGPELGEMVERVRAGKKVMLPAKVAARVSIRWHAGRAKGQRERFPQLDKCGHGLVHVRCKAAGCTHERGIPQGCSARRLCASCRERQAGPRRDTFARARAESISRASHLGLLRSNRAGGRWSEKHLTLTIPEHLVTGFEVVEQRIALLFAAWPGFIRLAKEWLDIRHNGADVDYFRAFEWTGGADRMGHPHFHVWFHCAYLPKHVLRYLWALTLHRLGARAHRLVAKEAREGTPAPAWAKRIGPLGVPVFGSAEDPKGDARARELARWWRKHREDSTRRPALRPVTTYPQVEQWEIPVILEVTEVVVRRTVSEGSAAEGYRRAVDGSFGRELIKGADAIKGAARPRLEIVRSSRGTAGEDVIGYLEGWLVSEYDSNGDRVFPETMAAVYRELEGRRSVQASKGFMASGAIIVRCPLSARDESGAHAKLDELGEKHLRADIVDHRNASIAAWREHFGLPPPAPRALPERRGPGVRRALPTEPRTSTAKGSQLALGALR